VEILWSARKHGILEADILHAIRHPIAYVEQDFDGERRMLIVGPSRSGALLEVVVVPSREPRRVIHADNLRPQYYYLVRR
jgi:uncharacterized DUF497 family protein